MKPTAKPIRNFKNTHSGIFFQLDRLSELPALLAPAELAKRTAESASSFFRKAVYAHHADEENALFPAVLESAASAQERKTVETAIHLLTAQHRNLEALWETLEPDLKKVAKGSSQSLDVASLQALVTLYQEHAEYEENVFLPLAEEILSRNPNHMEALGMTLHMHHMPMPIAHI